MDVDLVRRARSGDRAAQGKLAQRHRRSMYILALQLMGNRDDALDVVQDALLRFFTTLHRFDLRRPVKPWLYQIVRNRAVDLHRRRKVRRHESLDAVDHDGRRYEIRDVSVDPERDVVRSQLKARIWQSLDELSPKQREILVLRDYQDLSYTEIAETLDIPIGTVMSRLHGARKRLRSVLKDDLQTLLH
ncbi:MAG: sigma-70 family RNA polymerase sigma factor [Thermoanaerobaculia bacterium]